MHRLSNIMRTIFRIIILTSVQEHFISCIFIDSQRYVKKTKLYTFYKRETRY